MKIQKKKMNEQKYKIIYNYLSTSLYPKNVTDNEKRKIDQESSKYLIQQRQLFKKTENGNH